MTGRSRGLGGIDHNVGKSLMPGRGGISVSAALQWSKLMC